MESLFINSIACTTSTRGALLFADSKGLVWTKSAFFAGLEQPRLSWSSPTFLTKSVQTDSAVFLPFFGLAGRTVKSYDRP
jgi:hypothetical protein